MTSNASRHHHLQPPPVTTVRRRISKHTEDAGSTECCQGVTKQLINTMSAETGRNSLKRQKDFHNLSSFFSHHLLPQSPHQIPRARADRPPPTHPPLLPSPEPHLYTISRVHLKYRPHRTVSGTQWKASTRLLSGCLSTQPLQRASVRVPSTLCLII